LKNDDKVMRGGGEKIIPMFIDENNPGKPVEQEQIFTQRYGDVKQQHQQQQQQQYASHQPRPEKGEIVNLNLQVKQPPKPKPDTKDSFTMYPTITNTNPFFPAQMSSMFNPYASNMLGAMYPMTVNYNKVYEITTNGPVDKHSQLQMIYEDVIPQKSVSTTFKTVGERLTQIQYVRTILFQKGDGAEVNLDGNSANSLLSHIKFLELNPFNINNKFSNNPYKGLPDGFLIYRTCYPIKRAEPFGKAVCSKDSMAINVRIYKLNLGGYLLNKQDKTKFYEYEQWREIAFYEYIREHIIKKKLSPNFVNMYGYYLCKNSCIEFDKITLLNLGKPDPNADPLNPTATLNVWDKKQNDFVTSVVNGLRNINPGHIIQKISTDQSLQNIQPVQKPADLKDYNGEVIVSLTESPTYNLTSWASKTYQQEGNTRRMINTGFYTENVWKSIIFQLMSALYVMKIHNLYIKDLSIKNNVFIKDLVLEGQVINYWKYRINGIDYYVPNFGYVLLVDSNYKDVSLAVVPGSTVKPTSIKPEYKLDGPLFDAGNTIGSGTSIDSKLLEMFKAGIDPNNFGQDFISEGGTPPDNNILKLLGDMHKDTETDIEKYFIKYMAKFMNNRIGTYLKEQEIIHIRSDDLREFKKGQILVHEEGTGLYRFVLYLDTNNGTATVLTKNRTAQNDPQYIDKDNEIIIEKQVQITTLSNYSLTEPIVQNFKVSESNLTEENILETYNILV